MQQLTVNVSVCVCVEKFRESKMYIDAQCTIVYFTHV